MGHTKPQDLKDLQKMLDEVRKWEFLKEKSPNIFYFKSTPFLHFHDKDGKRWADVKDGENWGKQLEIAFSANGTVQRTFLKEVRRRYEKLARK